MPLGMGVAVDDDIPNVVEQLGRPVAPGLEAKQLGCVIDQRCRCLAGAKALVGDDILDERNVCLHTADAEFAQGTVHALESDLESGGARCHFH